jgi:hypothetical protein
MGRQRQRINLQESLGLNINRMIRRHLIAPRSASGPSWLTWSYTYTQERIATATLTSDLSEPPYGWVRVRVGSLDQTIQVVRQDRRFGGGQWYFICPYTHRQCSAIWLPNGANKFGSRHAWRRQVAYGSQFQSRHDRALATAQAIRARLGGPDWAGIDEFEPPKPKGMRWRTYNRLIDRSRDQEAIADERLFSLLDQWTNLS